MYETLLDSYKSLKHYKKTKSLVGFHLDMKMYYLTYTQHTLIIFDEKDQLLSYMEDTPDKIAGITAYMIFFRKMDPTLFMGLEGSRGTQYLKSDINAIRLHTGHTPRFVNDEEAILLMNILKMYKTVLKMVEEESPLDINDYYYFNKKELTLEVNALQLREPLDVDIHYDEELMNRFDSDIREGIWYVYVMYLNRKIDNEYPLELVAYTKSHKDDIRHEFLLNKEKPEILNKLLTMFKDETLPEKVICADRKTFAYIRPFIQRYKLDYSISMNDYFKKSYKYYQKLSQQL